MSSSSLNICNEIRCPWSRKSGCDRYTVSGHCHLLGKIGSDRREFLRDNQYWIFSDDNDPRLDINVLRKENEVFLATDVSTLRRIEFMKLEK